MFPLYAARHHGARYLVPSKHSPKLQKDFSTCRLCWWWQPRSRHALSVGRVYSESVIYNYNNNNNNFLFYEFYGRVRAVEVYTPDLPTVYSSVRDNSRISTWPRYAMCSRSGNRQPDARKNRNATLHGHCVIAAQEFQTRGFCCVCRQTAIVYMYL